MFQWIAVSYLMCGLVFAVWIFWDAWESDKTGWEVRDWILSVPVAIVIAIVWPLFAYRSLQSRFF